MRTGKSMRACEEWSEWLAFPRWSSKGYFTPKKRLLIARSPRERERESEGISAGGIYTVFIFCIRIRGGRRGDDQCLFNVAAGVKRRNHRIWSYCNLFGKVGDDDGLKGPAISQSTNVSN